MMAFFSKSDLNLPTKLRYANEKNLVGKHNSAIENKKLHQPQCVNLNYAKKSGSVATSFRWYKK